MKITKKEINKIIDRTPLELKGKFVNGRHFGMFTPSNANWSYHAEYIDYKGNEILVVTVYGQIQ